VQLGWAGESNLAPVVVEAAILVASGHLNTTGRMGDGSMRVLDRHFGDVHECPLLSIADE
jgi:choline dehydrogenase-like flavoprotein